MIEGLLTPPTVRNHENYREDANLSRAEDWIRNEVECFDSAVLMGVPSSENKLFAHSVEDALTDEAFNGADIYAHGSVARELDYFDPEIIEYDEMPSRIADIEWINDEISEDDDIAVFSLDYNVRTGNEMDRRLNDHRTFGQFTASFHDFQEFNVFNYIKGRLPGFESFEDEVQDPRKSFEYSLPEAGSSNAVVLNTAFSDHIRNYDDKMRSESIRHSLVMLPYGQKMKDTGKKGLNQVLDTFEY